MNSLVIDLAIKPTVAVCKEDKLAVSLSHEGKGADTFMQLVDDALGRANLGIEDINRVCVNVGPGSFTGERTAVSIAKGLCYGSDRKLFAFNSFDLFPDGDRVKVLYGFSNMVYVCDGKEMDCVAASTLENKRVDIIEPSLEKLLAGADVRLVKPRGFDEICALSKESKIHEIMPLYLRKSQAEIMREATLKNAKLAKNK